MVLYKNIGGNSNVAGYDIGDDRIQVVFKSGHFSNYLYTYSNPGNMHVEKMKLLASNGVGLNSYIRKYVRSNFESNW